MINERELDKLCRENGFHCNYFGSNAVITTNMDQWMIESISSYNKYSNNYDDVFRLKHRNKSGNKGKKAHFHTQRIVTNIKYAFETMSQHENGASVYNEAFKLKRLLQNVM